MNNDIFDYFRLLGDGFNMLNDTIADLNLYIGSHHVTLYTLLGCAFCTALIHILSGVESDSDFNACDLHGYGNEDDW